MTTEFAPVATAADLKTASAGLEGRTPQEILRWAVETYQPGLTLACSFGGPSGMVLLDMIMPIDRGVEVFYLDTDFLFPETYKLRDIAAARYGFEPAGYMSLLTPAQQAAKHGDALWARDPDACCALRKVEPNRRALEGKRAWISGIRRDQAPSRAAVDIVEWDEKFGLVKVNPLAAWTESQVWKYILDHGVPYNELHDQGYPSIGCTHCTKAVRPGDDPRSGRWQGFDKTECGIHVPEPAPGDPQEVATA
ncbi:MAG TPA: phosphoadenylyl-sulfate reductase [Dehalococcoidia bacterium]|nr:phosphoadenylyl-sulfate reductase [Dehalococcoidia bacterium]